jgi:UDP-GlcNAc:undecaprenyl-phosphate GlcNAc-1-phosphate transferase
VLFKYGTTFIVSLILALVATPLARKVAIKFVIMDIPRDDRFHKDPTPYLGGVALVFTFMVAVFTSYKPMWELSVILSAALILSVMGFVDDYRKKMNPYIKLGLQCLAGLMVYLIGIKINLFSYEILNFLLTIFWIVGITNSFNLLDNMDGLSAGIATIAALFFFVISALQEQYLVATLSAAIAGGCLGFLRYNFNPATIFMGDAGSHFLGFLLAIIGIKLRFGNPQIITFAVPILVLGLPIFDTTLVTVDRLIQRKPVWEGGTNHSSHRLEALIGSSRLAVLILYLASISLGCTALVLSIANYIQAVGLIVAVILLATVAFVILLKVSTVREG